MLDSRNFDRLTRFADESQWEQMPLDERELLGMLFVMQGEKQLNEGNEDVLQSFKIANQVVPDSAELIFRQAIVFAKQADNTSCLRTSCKLFKKATTLKKDFFHAWHGWANVYVLLGIHSHSERNFQVALKKFQIAEECSLNISKYDLGSLYRDWGVLWFHFGKLSGEAFDFRQSIKFFQRAIKQGFSAYDLYNDYGNCLIELSVLLNRPELIIESVEMYWRSVRIKSDFYDGWMNLSSALKILYELHPLNAYYNLANEGFQQAAQIDSQNGSLWLKWGQLHAFKGKITRDLDVIKDSCDKYEIADDCEPNHAAVLSSWAESLLLIGEWLEDLQFLKDAKEKIIRSLELAPKHPLIWCLYGNCLCEFGRYFNEGSYFHQAVEKYQYALKLAPKDPVVLYGIAMAYCSIGQFENNTEWLQEANIYCRKVIENGGHSHAQYWNDWGVVLMKLGMITDEKELVEAAMNRFEQALRVRSNQQKDEEMEPEWLYNYGCALDFLGDYNEDPAFFEKAIQVLKKVIELDPYFHQAYYNLAIAYSHFAELTADLNSYKDALRYIEAYLSLEPEDDYAWNELGLTLIDISQIMDDPSTKDAVLGMYQEAESKFIQARGLGSKPAVFYLACLYSLSGNYDASIHCLQAASQLKVLPSVEELISDQWLNGVRQTTEFKEFISNINS